MSTYIASSLDMLCESLYLHVHVSTLVGDSIVEYRLCVVTLMRYDAQTNLKVLNMIDFDAILEMNWLFPYHAILNCHNSFPTLISNSHDPKTQVVMTPILDGISFFLRFIL